MNDFTRSFPLEDIKIRSGGDGRTVEAYAAVFNQDVPISDQDGRYSERIDPSAFDKTIAERGTRFGVLFNHGMTTYGTPSDRGSMPIGVPLEVRADARGLLTVTRYNKTPLAEETLEAINSRSITAQSFQGSFIRSDKMKPRGGFRANSAGVLPTVTRQEIKLKEYGPTPFPAYEGATIVGVRAAGLSELDASLLALILDGLEEDASSLDQIVNSLTRSAEVLDDAQSMTAALLGDTESSPILVTLAARLASATVRIPAPNGVGSDGSLARSGRTEEIKKALHKRLAARGITNA